MMTQSVLFSGIFCVILVYSLKVNGHSIVNVEGPGEPLYLSKYIAEGRLTEARKASVVKSFVGNVKSYSGYITVDKKYDSNLFFWYFQSEKNHKHAPTVIWLEGGPGNHMYSGVFNNVGPYEIRGKKLHKRKYTWSKVSNLIFFDNPVGAGYSFTKKDKGFATNQRKVGSDLYKALVEIFQLFPYLQKNDLYIAGESYAGKYVPALGHTIHLNNKKKPEVKMNLKGLLIGDGFTDPLHMLKYSDYLYDIGLIDNNVKAELKKLEKKAAQLIKHRKWHVASVLFDRTMGDHNYSLFYNVTGFRGDYNFYDPSSGSWKDSSTKLIASTTFRKHLHVGNNKLNDGIAVYKHLFDDIPKSVIKWVKQLLNHYKILFFNGQLDVLCAYPLMENFLKEMKWPLSRQYKKAQRHIYRVGDDVAGYYKTVGNLTEVLVRNAGHMVIANQPVWTFQLFHDFITNKTFEDTAANTYMPYYKRILNELNNL